MEKYEKFQRAGIGCGTLCLCNLRPQWKNRLTNRFERMSHNYTVKS